MPRRIRHYGWMVSPYTAKTRAYLHFAEVPFDDIAPTLPTLYFKIARAVGAFIMPTVELADGTFMKDSSDIVDHFARLSPAFSVTPTSPRQRITSAVLEVFADEWLPMVALYYRWRRPKNAAFAIAEFGKNGVPFLPVPLQRMVGAKLGARMQGYLPVLGVTHESAPGIERMTQKIIVALEETLSNQPYLLGARPCLGDFAMYGPLFAHLFRDPESTALFVDAPNVRAWIARMHHAKIEGPFLEADAVPEGVERILRLAFAEQWPYLEKLVAAIDAYCDAHPDAKRVPRALGQTAITLDGIPVRRKLITFSQWKMQRACEAYRVVPGTQKAQVDRWLDGLGGLGALTRPIAHPFIHDHNRIVLAR